MLDVYTRATSESTRATPIANGSRRAATLGDATTRANLTLPFFPAHCFAKCPKYQKHASPHSKPHHSIFFTGSTATRARAKA
eukprot:1235809-Prymnesium_polylepis.1